MKKFHKFLHFFFFFLSTTSKYKFPISNILESYKLHALGQVIIKYSAYMYIYLCQMYCHAQSTNSQRITTPRNMSLTLIWSEWPPTDIVFYWHFNSFSNQIHVTPQNNWLDRLKERRSFDFRPTLEMQQLNSLREHCKYR